MPTVVDATAGLGRDAFLLASVGAKVVMLERSAEVHALLEDALGRARAASPALAEVVARMSLIHGDARDYLPKLQAEIVIVDPMHPPRQNSALVKKEMRLLAGIVGADEDAHELMRVALASARDHVVLKWPLSRSPFAKDPGAVISILRQDRSIRGILDRNESRMRPEQGDDRKTPSPAPAAPDQGCRGRRRL